MNEKDECGWRDECEWRKWEDECGWKRIMWMEKMDVDEGDGYEWRRWVWMKETRLKRLI